MVDVKATSDKTTWGYKVVKVLAAAKEATKEVRANTER
jgi:hypothetical protein